MTGIIAQNVGRTSGLIKAASGGTSTGAWTLIETITASSDSTIDFDSDIDSTYPIYVFKCINIHPETDNAEFHINFRDGSTAYDATKTTTYIKTRHAEADNLASTGYDDGNDVAQGTGVQRLIENAGADNDQCLSGTVQLFSPSDTTFIKHFISCNNVMYEAADGTNYSFQSFVAGYGNTTSAVDAVQFNYAAGNIDAGDICLYGITT